jgi:hypothetical protein
VALTAKRQLRRQFAAPELRAYCTVYDHLIPDDERRLRALVARSLSIPIDFQAMDDGALFDWVGRLSPAEPLADFVMGPFLDQLARLSSRARRADRLRRRHVADGGGPPALEGAPGPRRADRARARARLVRDQQRALPPIGVRTSSPTGSARPRRGAVRAGCARSSGARRPRRALVGGRTPLRRRARASRRARVRRRAWGRSSTPRSRLPRPSDRFRHPLLDLRLIRFAIGCRRSPGA